MPGVPGEPAPGVPGDSGPKITLQGDVTLENWIGGDIRIDLFDGDQQNLTGPRPSVVASIRLDAPGRYSVHVSEEVEKVWLGAYADVDRDGRPGPTDPVGWYPNNPVYIGADQSGLDIQLELQTAPRDL